jgi:hypothetical protein
VLITISLMAGIRNITRSTKWPGSGYLTGIVARVASRIAADDSQLRNIRDMRSFPANHRGSREKIGWPRNGPTVFALLGKELGQVINLQSAENKDGKPTPGGKVYTRH